jgi:hypothetical protein
MLDRENSLMSGLSPSCTATHWCGYNTKGLSLAKNSLDSRTTSKSFTRFYQGGEIYFSKEKACHCVVCLPLNVLIMYPCLILSLSFFFFFF